MTAMQPPAAQTWTIEAVLALFELPFADLLFKAQSLHRANFDPNAVQVSTLLSIKTGGCTEDCKYCSQSSRHDTGLVYESLMPLDQVLEAAKAAKATGASRFCMGAAWRSPKERDIEAVEAMVKGVKSLGMEACMTLGMLSEEQASRLKEAGLDYYNHNLDTSERHYSEIVSTHTYQDRLDTLDRVRKSGIKLCSGGILGLGETREDRAAMLQLLSRNPPDSVPLNRLVPIPGTKMEDADPVDEIEFVRTIAIARILMPKSFIRLSAGRESMSDSLQALCFQAGANSVFGGERLLTTPGAASGRDEALFAKLGLSRL
jgi:biotin synthase